MPAAAFAPQWLSGSWGAGDTTAPTLNITVNPDVSIISDKSGFTTATVSFAVDEPYQAYEIRKVTAAGDARGAGVLIESGSGGPANTNRQIDITYSEWTAAALATGQFLFKLFAQDTAGNWST